MLFSRVTPARGAAAVVACATALALLALVAVPGAHAAPPDTFKTLASSPMPVNNLALDPANDMIYAQGYGSNSFYSYSVKTNHWKTLASAPVNQQNNGGAAYVKGKIYTVYAENSAQMGVYNVAKGTWKVIANPLHAGTGDITAVGGRIYLVSDTAFVSYNPATGATKVLAPAPSFNNASTEFSEEVCAGAGFEAWGGLAGFKGKIYGTQGNGCNGSAVYSIHANKWKEARLVPGFTVLGGAIDPVAGTYFAYGGYGENGIFSYHIASGKWSTLTFPFSNLNDGGLVYVPTPGRQGIYATFGQASTGFVRLTTKAGADVSVANRAGTGHAKVGHSFTYTVRVRNGGAKASKVTLSDKLSSKVSIGSVTTSKGTCSASHNLKCRFGTLKSGHAVKVKITVTARRKGTARSTAMVATASFNASSKTSSSVRVKIS